MSDATTDSPAAEPVRFSFTYTAADYQALQCEGLRHSPTIGASIRRMRWALPVVLVVATMIWYHRHGDAQRVAVQLSIAAAWWLFLPAALRWRAARIARRAAAKGWLVAYLGRHEVVADERMIDCAYPGGRTETRWSSILGVSETAEHCFLWNTHASAITLPKREIAADDLERLRRWSGRAVSPVESKT